MVAPNLPVGPYDGPYSRHDKTQETPWRDPFTGAWKSDHTHAIYSEEINVLVEDAKEIEADMLRLQHQVRHVGHVATRETCKLTLDAAVALINSVRDLLQIEADG